MSALVTNIIQFLGSLNLEEKLSPRKNKEIIWFYIFLPSLIIYFVFLSEYLNTKPSIGAIQVFDNEFLKIVNPSSKIEVIATGLNWTEGPVWINDELPYLLFSDTVQNRIYKWEEGKGMFTIGKSIYLERSGCRDRESCALLREGGSNGLIRRDATSYDLLACLHGERSVSLLRENGTRSAIATHYKGKRLNSPNDLVWSPDGHLYFTDPTYGLYRPDYTIQDQELTFSGLYMVKADYVQQALEQGEATAYVRLLEGALRQPNGLAFSPDFSKLYVSDSDAQEPAVHVFEVTDDGSLVRGKVFFSFKTTNNSNTCDSNSEETVCSNEVQTQAVSGVPDGLKVDVFGNVFVGSGQGVLVLSSEGQLLGQISLGKAASNLVFGSDQRLYITSGEMVVRVAVKTKPARIMKKGKLL